MPYRSGRRKYPDSTRSKKPEAAGSDVPVQYVLPLDLAPQELIDHGYRDAHSFPLVSPDVDQVRRSFRVHPAVAWRFPRLELRTGNSFPAVLMDCDGPESVDRLMRAVTGADLREPNVITRRKESGNAHAAWMLASPVHRGDNARKTPLRFLARISEFYQHQLLADPGFTGVLTLNPTWKGPEFETLWLRRAPYELAELAEAIPPGWRRPRVATSAVGRNVDLFRWAVKEAHRPRSAQMISAAAVKDAPDWIAYVNRHNVDTWGTHALPIDEVRHVARHAAGYSLRQYSKERFSEIQQNRGKRSGKARREANRERDRKILADRANGLSLRSIASRHGLTEGAVRYVLRRGVRNEP